MLVDLLDNLLLLGGAAGIATVATDLRRGDGSNADDGLEGIGVVCLVDGFWVACELTENIVVGIIADGDVFFSYTGVFREFFNNGEVAHFDIVGVFDKTCAGVYRAGCGDADFFDIAQKVKTAFLANLCGKPVTLRIRMMDADIYAVRFGEGVSER